MKTKFGCFYLADYHGGNENGTPDIQKLQSLRMFLPNNKLLLKDINYIVILGDFFDRLLTFNKPSTFFCLQAIHHILTVARDCEKEVIVLEGTKSHDRGQNFHFRELNDAMYNVKLTYIEELSVHFFDGFSVLALPDNHNHDANKTKDDILNLLKKHNLEKVDLIWMHGAFSLQLRGEISKAYHDADFFSDIVNWQVVSGHIHTRWTYKKIQTPGSFSRERHGEEEPKGALKVIYETGKKPNAKFIENRYTRLFLTVNVSYLNIPDSIQLIGNLGDLPPNSAIRLEYVDETPIKAMMGALMDIFPHYVFTSINRSVKSTSTLPEINIQNKVVGIHENNIVSLMEERLRHFDDKELILKTFKDILEEV